MRARAKAASVALGVILMLAITGCPKKVVKQEPIAPPPVPIDTTPVVVEQPKVELATVHFDFDKYDIRPGDANILNGNADNLKKAGNPMVSLEGHCDPIGTSEYNMALGMRRAEAVKAYLVKLGIAASQLSTISYGEEKLVTTNPAEFEQDRRCESKVTSK